MIIRLVKNGVRVIGGDGHEMFPEDAVRKTQPPVKDRYELAKDVVREPKKMFYCRECKTQSDAAERTRFHFNHDGGVFEPNKTFFKDYVPARGKETGEIVWVKKPTPISLPSAAI